MRAARAFSVARRRGLVPGEFSGRKSQASSEKQHCRGSQLSAYAQAKHGRAYCDQPSALQYPQFCLHDLNRQRSRLVSLSIVRCHHGLSEAWSFEVTGRRLRSVAGNCRWRLCRWITS